MNNLDGSQILDYLTTGERSSQKLKQDKTSARYFQGSRYEATLLQRSFFIQLINHARLVDSLCNNSKDLVDKTPFLSPLFLAADNHVVRTIVCILPQFKSPQGYIARSSWSDQKPDTP